MRFVNSMKNNLHSLGRLDKRESIQGGGGSPIIRLSKAMIKLES